MSSNRSWALECPSGGITAENAAAYLGAGALAVGMGSNLVAPAAVERGDWRRIEAEARSAVRAVRAFQGG